MCMGVCECIPVSTLGADLIVILGKNMAERICLCLAKQ